MNRPTEAQIKEFCEWCGFRHTESPNEFIRRNWWTNPEHLCESHLPPIDLNNLFKYAVPKLESWDCIIDWAIDMINAYADGRTLKDPALALFWAIYEVVIGKPDEL